MEKFTVTPSITVKYADPRGPQFPQLHLYANRKANVPVRFRKLIEATDPKAEFSEIKADSTKIEVPDDNSGDDTKPSLDDEKDTKEDKDSVEIPEGGDQKEKKEGTQKKSRFLGKKGK